MCVLTCVEHNTCPVIHMWACMHAHGVCTGVHMGVYVQTCTCALTRVAVPGMCACITCVCVCVVVSADYRRVAPERQERVGMVAGARGAGGRSSGLERPPCPARALSGAIKGLRVFSSRVSPGSLPALPWRRGIIPYCRAQRKGLLWAPAGGWTYVIPVRAGSGGRQEGLPEAARPSPPLRLCAAGGPPAPRLPHAACLAGPLRPPPWGARSLAGSRRVLREGWRRCWARATPEATPLCVCTRPPRRLSGDGRSSPRRC